MEKQGFYPDLKNLRAKYLSILLIALFFMSAALAVRAADGEDFESPEPVLISEADSFYALTADPGKWNGQLPGKNRGYYLPGSRVMIFVTNINLAAGEDAGAFRAFAEALDGTKFRLTVENITPL